MTLKEKTRYLLVSAFLKRGRVLALTKDDFDLHSSILKVTKLYDKTEKLVVNRLKGKKKRNLEIGDSLKVGLSEFIKDRNPQKNEPLISNRNRQNYNPRDLCPIHKKVLKQAELDHITIHDLRHTFASHFVMRGGNLATLQAILGHSSYATTLQYAHLSPEHLQSQANIVSFDGGLSQAASTSNIISLAAPKI